MPLVNNGLMIGSALGNAVKEGLQAFRQGRQDTLREKNAGLENALLTQKAGLIPLSEEDKQTQDTGFVGPKEINPYESYGYKLSPDALKKQQLEASTTQRSLDEMDPNSEASKQKIGYYRGLLNQVKPGSGSIIPDKISASELEGKSGLLSNYISAIKSGGTVGVLTPGQKSLDVMAGKEYADYVASGGSAQFAKHLSNINDAIEQLKNKEVETGGASSVLPDFARARIDAKGVALQQQVQDAVMSSLKQVLGAQFTEREGQKVLATAYDPNLPTEENIKKLTNLSEKLQNMAASKEASMRFFEDRGSLKGFKGPIYEAKNKESDTETPLRGKTKEAGIGLLNANPSKPKQVIQGGHTYILNEKTGEYE